ncbi:hypothetical protein ABFX02_13G007100 [Erythranthe guttata]
MVRASCWEMYGSAPLARINALVYSTCFAYSSSLSDAALAYCKLIQHFAIMYTGKVKASPAEVATCADESCAHDACGPAINYAVEMMYASAAFQIKELVMVVQPTRRTQLHPSGPHKRKKNQKNPTTLSW